jgi:hypothetical protein
VPTAIRNPQPIALVEEDKCPRLTGMPDFLSVFHSRHPTRIFGIISIGFVFTILATQKEVSIFAFFVLGGDGTMKPRANFAVAGFPESRSNNPFYINNLYYQRCEHYTVIASPISATKIGNLSFKI